MAGRAEKAETRRAIRRERRRQIKAETPSGGGTGRGLGRFVEGYDFVLIALILLLSLFGVAMVFSAGYYQTINSADPDPAYYLVRQLIWVTSGFGLLFITSHIDYHWYMKFFYLIAVISALMLVAVMLVGVTVNNAQRWIQLGPLRITPSEFSKAAMIIFTSCFFVKDPDNIRTFKGLFIIIGVMTIHFLLIVRQPNLSTAIVIAAIMGAIMLVAGLHPIFILLAGAAGVGGYFYIMKYATSTHWYNRLTSFVDPFADRQGEGYQVTQGLIALGNGGLKGLGFGRSVAKNLYLPEPQNDFILAVIGEELGYIGFVVLMLIYMILLFRLVMTALRAKDRLGFYLSTGAAVMLGLQVIINVAVVTSSMPATGITLPFISYGGASIWSFMIVMGIVLNVSRKRNETRS